MSCTENILANVAFWFVVACVLMWNHAEEVSFDFAHVSHPQGDYY